MSDVPERFKPLDDWTPDDHLEHRRSGKPPENPEYAERRRRVLADAGLEPADEPKRRHVARRPRQEEVRMTTTALPRGRYGTEHPDWRMLLPDGLKLPKAVKAANDRARRLMDEFDQAGQPLGELEQAVKRAAPQDRQAAEAQLADARIRRDQARADAVDAVFDLRDAVAGHREELEAAIRDAIGEQLAGVAAALAQIPSAVDTLRRDHALLAAIGRAATGGYLHDLDFRVPGLEAAQRRREKAERQEWERPKFASASTRDQVPRDVREGKRPGLRRLGLAA